MSFSSELKNEIILNAQQDGDCCMIAELSALLALGGSLYLKNGGRGLRFSNENAAVTRRVFSMIKSATGVSCEIRAAKRTKLKLGNLYTLDISDAKAAAGLLSRTGISKEGMGFTRIVPRELLSSDCCKRAYIRGAFLAAGTISDPARGYHLEIAGADGGYAESFCAFLQECSLNAKLSARKDEFVVYIKDSESIVDFMVLAGASSSVFSLENTRILKEIRNNANRAVNCDIANESKSLAAAQAQVEDIEYIILKDIFKTLSRQLRETAEIRLENPEASLQDLGGLHSPPQSKSCVNHRLGKLRSIARERRQEEENQYDYP